MNADAVSTLCLHCGLCCNGSLFTHIAPRPGELEVLRAAGARVRLVERRDGSCVIGLPCPALEGTRCSAYEQRPVGCRDFVCRTASALAADTIDQAQALARVDEAKRRIALVAQQLPVGAGEASEPVLRRARAHGLTEGPAALREAEAWLDEHFR